MVSLTIVLDADPLTGELSMGVRPVKKEANGFEMQAADRLNYILKAWFDSEDLSRTGGLIVEKETEIRENPVVFTELMIDLMRHHPQPKEDPWGFIRGKFLEELSGKSFKVMTELEVERAKASGR